MADIIIQVLDERIVVVSDPVANQQPNEGNEDAFVIAICEQGPQGIQGPPGSGGSNVTWDYKLKTADYYVTLGLDYFIDVDCTAGDITIHLPETIPEEAGYWVSLKKIDLTPSVVRVVTTNGQTADGVTEFDIESPQETYSFTSTGTGYRIW